MSKAEEIVDWLSNQKYEGENILHAAVCCDFAGRARFIKEIEDILDPPSKFPEQYEWEYWNIYNSSLRQAIRMYQGEDGFEDRIKVLESFSSREEYLKIYKLVEEKLEIELDDLPEHHHMRFIVSKICSYSPTG